jgi:biopolymer transport protein ExbD
VNEEGKTFLQDERGATEEIPEGGVADVLRNARLRKPTAFIILKGDKKTKFGAVSDVMDAFVEADATRFNLMTELKTTKR